MAKKTDIRTCRFADCPYNHQIDISTDNYKIIGRTKYYHADCLDKQRAVEFKDEKAKADLQYIKKGWITYISKTVNYGQLFQCLNELLSRDIPSDYLVFVFDYVVKHKMNLRFPGGFKYYVDREEIKVAYKKQQIETKVTKKINEFTTADSSNTPKFTIKQKPSGFSSILGGKK